jgi:hypothetical protein
MASTKKCVLCFEKATCFGGHVHKEKETIIAGFCKTHFKTLPTIDGCNGCYGQWKEQMEVDKSFGQLMYIDKDGLHPVDDEE